MLDIPQLYKDLSLNDPYELNQFISDVIDVMVEAEIDSGLEDGQRGFTYAEIRDLLEAYFDKTYSPSDRHLERKPTQREVNFALEAMLSTDRWEDLVIREKDGLIYMISEDEREFVNNAHHEAGYPKDENFRRAQSHP